MRKLLKSLLILLLFISIGFSQLYTHNSYVKTGNWKLLSDYEGDFPAAVSDIGATVTTLKIYMQPDTLTANLTIPSTLTLEWGSGFPLIAEALTDTLKLDSCYIDAGNYAIFDTSLMIGGRPKINEFNLMWYGATGDGVTDDTRYIQIAIDRALNQVPKVCNNMWAPGGRYMFTEIIFGDSTTTVGLKGYINFRGGGPQTGDENFGRVGNTTIFESTKYSGDSFVINRTDTTQGDNYRMQSSRFRNFSVRGKQSGVLVRAQQFSADGEISGLEIFNDSSGVAFYGQNMWTSNIRDINITGTGKGADGGVGFWYDTKDGNGGMVSFSLMTMQGFHTAMRIGPDDVAENPGSAWGGGLSRNSIFKSIQPKDAYIGLEVGSAGYVFAEGFHFEGLDSFAVKIKDGGWFDCEDCYVLGNILIEEDVADAVFDRSKLRLSGGRIWDNISVEAGSDADIMLSETFLSQTDPEEIITFDGAFTGTVTFDNVIHQFKEANDTLSNKQEFIYKRGLQLGEDFVYTDTLDLSNQKYMPQVMTFNTSSKPLALYLPENENTLLQNYDTVIHITSSNNPLYLICGLTDVFLKNGGGQARDTLSVANEYRVITPLTEGTRILYIQH